MKHAAFFAFLLVSFANFTAAATAPTFCKCTCFTNSTIIEIKPKHYASSSTTTSTLTTTSSTSTADPSSPTSDLEAPISEPRQQDLSPLSRRSRPGSGSTAGGSALCSQCNRAFCLEQSLPICKGAEEKDVVTMCFQRDSRKDQIIVWAFIVGTTGLLAYAGAQKLVEVLESRKNGRGDASNIADLRAGGRVRGDGESGSGRAGVGRNAQGEAPARGTYQQVGSSGRGEQDGFG